MFERELAGDLAKAGDRGEAGFALARMRGMIERLGGLAVAPWADAMGAILEDGAFQRAMRLVPAGEAQALWVAFDAEMERLCATMGPDGPAVGG